MEKLEIESLNKQNQDYTTSNSQSQKKFNQDKGVQKQQLFIRQAQSYIEDIVHLQTQNSKYCKNLNNQISYFNEESQGYVFSSSSDEDQYDECGKYNKKIREELSNHSQYLNQKIIKNEVIKEELLSQSNLTLEDRPYLRRENMFFEIYFHEVSIKSAFEREFSYKKGNIDYFDPDFQGKVEFFPSKYHIIYKMELEGFKDKLYMRVMMTMMKKVCRYIIQFQMVEEAMHSQCGKQFIYEITFFFKYRLNFLGGKRVPPLTRTYNLSPNVKITVYYIKQNDQSFNQLGQNELTIQTYLKNEDEHKIKQQNRIKLDQEENVQSKFQKPRKKQKLVKNSKKHQQVDSSTDYSDIDLIYSD
ncbi:hypothetical protein PPERSA_01149 [Pseudocohnilembus persalinus]|uniref:Uncharacterized protein n=1 Tax=Pseudocohnilembus persalinus TaxID=266149 RepID=A0A0V0QUZ4_PSEPJ|nr:hypothetical protein PPERSA_01149 [Pseudocohnilembus persalinus]|eukprot:KRX06071.1 hypothetical protein PPERSA_01149 [Pseudocohnilembus persalinus]